MWAKFDDSLSFNRKIVAAGNAAVGLWLRMITYSCGQLTDGFVPMSVAEMLGSKKELTRVISSGLAHEVDGGIQIHDFLAYQPSKQTVLINREATRSRVERHRKSTGKFGNDVSNGNGNALHTPLVTETKKTRKTRVGVEFRSTRGASIDLDENQKSAENAGDDPDVTPLVTTAPSRPVPNKTYTRARAPGEEPIEGRWARICRVPIPGPRVHEADALIAEYANATETPYELAAELCLDAFYSWVQTWDVPSSATPAHFIKHWQTVQGLVDKRASGKVQSAAARLAKKAMAARGDS